MMNEPNVNSEVGVQNEDPQTSNSDQDDTEFFEIMQKLRIPSRKRHRNKCKPGPKKRRRTTPTVDSDDDSGIVDDQESDGAVTYVASDSDSSAHPKPSPERRITRSFTRRQKADTKKKKCMTGTSERQGHMKKLRNAQRPPCYSCSKSSKDLDDVPIQTLILGICDSCRNSFRAGSASAATELRPTPTNSETNSIPSSQRKTRKNNRVELSRSEQGASDERSHMSKNSRSSKIRKQNRVEPSEAEQEDSDGQVFLPLPSRKCAAARVPDTDDEAEPEEPSPRRIRISEKMKGKRRAE
ncbi:hypothetical protein C8R44DRAFT_11317 [Mycena epipterygia]|nr:hypothetical protein C8R44DRAFT_11317 [Mycena epipterygia]